MLNMLAFAGPLFPGGIVNTVVVIIAVIIGGGLLLWALKTAVTNFVAAEWQPKVMAIIYIVVALLLAVLIFRWAGLA